MRGEFSSGLGTDRNADDNSSMLNVEDVSQNADQSSNAQKVRAGNFAIIDSSEGDYEEDFVDEVPMPNIVGNLSRVSPINGRTPFNRSGNFSNTAMSPT